MTEKKTRRKEKKKTLNTYLFNFFKGLNAEIITNSIMPIIEIIMPDLKPLGIKRSDTVLLSLEIGMHIRPSRAWKTGVIRPFTDAEKPSS